MLLHLSINLAASVGGILVFLAAETLVVQTIAMFVSTAGSMGVGTHTHNSAHNATSDRRSINELLTYFGFPFFLGLSATFWKHRHNVVHHRSPNVIGVDEDADLKPWFVLTANELARSSGCARFYYERIQWLVLPVLLGANGFNMQRAGWSYLCGALADSGRRKAAHWYDLSALVLHALTTLVLPMSVFAPLEVVGFYLLRIGLVGYAMFAVLAPGHYPPEAARFTRPLPKDDYLWSQTAATTNFRSGAIGRILCCGLEFQIEHHLFPDISYVHYPGMKSLVQALCSEYGLPYRCYPWRTAIWEAWRVFRKPSLTKTLP